MDGLGFLQEGEDVAVGVGEIEFFAVGHLAQWLGDVYGALAEGGIECFDVRHGEGEVEVVVCFGSYNGIG